MGVSLKIRVDGRDRHAVNRWERSPNRNNANNFALVNTDGSSNNNNSRNSYALTPISKEIGHKE